jgi:hypothetical protein
MMRAIAASAALMVALSAGAGAPASGSTATRALSGKTRQGFHVTLGRPSRGVRSFSYRARLDCSDGTSFIEGRFADDVRPRRGVFRVRHASDGGATKTTVVGTIGTSRAAGWLKIVERYGTGLDASGAAPLDPRGPVTCTSRTVRWTAR